MKYSTTVQSISAQQLVALSEAFPGIRVRPSDNRYLSIEWRDDVKEHTPTFSGYGYDNTDNQVVWGIHAWVNGPDYRCSSKIAQELQMFLDGENITPIIDALKAEYKQYCADIDVAQRVQDDFDNRVSSIMESNR